MLPKKWHIVGLAICLLIGLSVTVVLGKLSNALIPALIAHGIVDVLTMLWVFSRRLLAQKVPLYDKVFWTIVAGTFFLIFFANLEKLMYNEQIGAVASALSVPLMIYLVVYSGD